MEFLKSSDCADESRKDETCLQFKMNKHFIKTWKSLSKLLAMHFYIISLYVKTNLSPFYIYSKYLGKLTGVIKIMQRPLPR